MRVVIIIFLAAFELLESQGQHAPVLGRTRVGALCPRAVQLVGCALCALERFHSWTVSTGINHDEFGTLSQVRLPWDSTKTGGPDDKN